MNLRSASKLAAGLVAIGALEPEEAEAATPLEMAIANKTARAFGSVGNRLSVAARDVAENIPKDMSILDFGSGKVPRQTQLLRDMGYKNVTPFDFGGNIVEGVHDPAALLKRYDTVMASNVMNVQQSKEMLNETLGQMARSTKKDGVTIANYPKSPRYSNLSEAEMKEEMGKYFGEISFNKKTGVFRLAKPLLGGAGLATVASTAQARQRMAKDQALESPILDPVNMAIAAATAGGSLTFRAAQAVLDPVISYVMDKIGGD